MSQGPGKYNDLCEAARKAAQARGAILIIFDGSRGHGFEVQCEFGGLLRLPETLRTMADEIEESLRTADPEKL